METEKIQSYIIVSGRGVGALTGAVKPKLDEGYEPIGGPFTLATGDIAQALIRHGDPSKREFYAAVI